MQIKEHPIFKVLVTTEGVIYGKKGKPLKPAIQNDYHVVSLCGKACRVHRVVVETFIGEIPKTHCVNHKDGDKINNNLENLEIVTYKENTLHAYRTGLAIGKKGSENSGAKLLLHQVLEIYKMIKEGKTNEEIGFKFNLHSRYISLVRHGKRWKHIYNEFFKSGVKSCGDLNLPLDYCFTIFRACLDKSKTNKAISKEFMIDPSTICRIRNKKTWISIWQLYELNATTIENTDVSVSE